MKKGCKSTIPVLIILFLSLGAFSQIRETGTIHGTVTDDQGEPLPGVTVKISGPAIRSMGEFYVTDQKGNYRFANLPVGPYTVSVDLQGFAKLVREVINLNANMTLTVDFRMVQSMVIEEIVVKADPPTIDIKSSSSGVVVMSDVLLLSLPTPKNFSGLMSIATGIESTTLSGNTYTPAYGMGTGQSNAYSFDGIDVSSSRTGTTYFSPDFNTIQQASISAIGLPAEFGGFTGAVLSAVSKSGTNELSALWETWLNGRNWNSQNLASYSADRFVNPADKDKLFDSGSHFDIGLQAGGRIIHDKLWLFLSGQFDSAKNYPLGYAEAQSRRSMKGFMKLSYQLSGRTKMNLTASVDDKNITNALASPRYLPEADVNVENPGIFLDLNMTSMLSTNTYFDLKLGYFGQNFTQTPKNGYDLTGRYDLARDLVSVNARTYNRDKDRTGHASAHISHYFPELLIGSHDTKIGTEIVYSAPITATGYPGGAMLYDLNAVPYMKIEVDPAYLESNHYFSQTTVFAQDSWMMNKRLTINLGLRFDHYWYKIPTGDRGIAYQNNNIAPRIGLAYDLLGDRKNILKLHYGHYYDKLYQTMFNEAETRAARWDFFFWNGADYVYSFSQQLDSSSFHIDTDIKQPYISEISASFERELFRNASLSVAYYSRKAARFLGWVNTVGDWQEVTIVNPGLDGVAGTADDLGNMTVYERLNPSAAGRLLTNPVKGQTEAMVDDPKYSASGLEVIFAKRYSNRWQMIASYHYTRVKGNASSTYTILGLDPNYFVNSYGELGSYYGQPHQFKLQANVLLPWDIDMGIIAQYSSGADKGASFYQAVGVQTLLFNVVAPGTLKYEPRKQFDLRIQKQFNLKKGKLSVMGDIFNAFNSNRVLSANRMVGANYDKIYVVQNPRTFRVGLRFAF